MLLSLAAIHPSPTNPRKLFKEDKLQELAESIRTKGVLQPIVVRLAFKPTPSIRMPLETIDQEGAEQLIATKGHHDPCVGIRGAAVAEAMMALVLADQKLLHEAQCGRAS